MSSSTIFIKRPLNYRQSLALIKEKYKEFSPVLSVILWTVSGLYAASRSHFNNNITGVTLAFPVYQLVMMSFASLLLCKGLSDKNVLLILPWIGVTAYTMYYNHYKGLLETLAAISRIRKLTWLPWSTLSINILLLIIRGTLTIRIFQLCIHVWVKKKIREIKEQQL